MGHRLGPCRHEELRVEECWQALILDLRWYLIVEKLWSLWRT